MNGANGKCAYHLFLPSEPIFEYPKNIYFSCSPSLAQLVSRLIFGHSIKNQTHQFFFLIFPVFQTISVSLARRFEKIKIIFTEDENDFHVKMISNQEFFSCSNKFNVSHLKPISCQVPLIVVIIPWFSQ